MEGSMKSFCRSVLGLASILMLCTNATFAYVPKIVSLSGYESSEPKSCFSTSGLLRTENLNAATITAKTSASTLAWSSASTWATGVVPKAGEDVVIPTGAKVLLDRNIDVKSVNIMGLLTVDVTKNISISAEYIMVMGAGAVFQWGTEAKPYTMEGSITLVGSNTAAMIPGHSTVNSKALVAMDGAALELHGKVKTSWTNLSANAAAGATTITIADNNNNWEV